MIQKTPAMFLVTLVAACGGTEPAAESTTQARLPLDAGAVVIDDFQSGYDALSLASGAQAKLQTGTMAGGVREIYLVVDANPLEQRSGYTLNGAGGLVVSSGLDSFWGAALSYGYDQGHQVGALDLDLSGSNAVRLTFGSNDQPVSGGIELYEGQSFATANWYAGASDSPFSVDIPFSELETSTGAPLTLEHVDFVTLVVQSASAHAGNDLELTSIAAVHLGE